MASQAQRLTRSVTSTHSSAKRSHLTSPPKDFGYDGVLPSPIEPVLDRISGKTLMSMFENDVAFCLKGFRLSNSNGESQVSDEHANSKFRLLLTQFRSTLEKFQRHIPVKVYVQKCIEVGEALLDIQGFHLIAQEDCFAPAIHILSSNAFLKPEDRPDSQHSKSISAAQAAEDSQFKDFHDKLVDNGLRCRALLNYYVSQWLHALHIDPGLKGFTAVSLVLETLDSMVQLAAESESDYSLAWVSYFAFYHISSICHKLAQNGWSLQVLRYLELIVAKSETYPPFVRPDHLPWRIEFHRSLFALYITIDRIESAEHMLAQANAKLNEMRLEETEGDEVNPQNIIFLNQAEFELNELLFACEIKRLAGERSEERLALLQKIIFTHSLNPATALPTSIQPRILSLQSYVSEKSYDFHTSDVTRRYLSVPVPSLRLHSYENQSKTYANSSKMFIKASLENMRSLIDVESPTKPSPSDKEVDYSAKFAILPSDRANHDPTHDKELPPHPSSAEAGPVEGESKRKAHTKKTKTVEETEEAKIKRILNADILCLLQVLKTDRDRLAAIAFSLKTIKPSDIHLKINEKSTEDGSQIRETVVSKLLDFAYLIITSDENFITHEHALSHYHEYKGGRKFSFPDIHKLRSSKRLVDFSFHDLMVLNRFYFDYRQWERLHCFFELSASVLQKNSELMSLYGLEMTLRASASRFLLTLYAERKVLFEPKLKDRATASDAVVSRFDLTNQLRGTASEFLRSICDCIQNSDFFLKEKSLIFQSSMFLWYFAEPFVRDLKNNIESRRFSKISRDDSVLIVLEFVHLLQSLLPGHDPITANTISSRLALLLETTGHYEHAVDVLSATIRNIDAARLRLGEGSNLINSTTADTSFHRGLSRQILEEEGFNNPSGLLENPEVLSVRKQLSASQVLLLSSLYRCRLKSLHQRETKELRSLELKHLKLTKKRIHLKYTPIVPTEEILMKNCGSDLVRRALYLIAVVEMGTDLSSVEKIRLLDESSALLLKAHNYETELLKPQYFDPNPESNWYPVLVRRTPTSVTISPGRLDRREVHSKLWFQAFGSVSGNYLGQNNVDLRGTGQMFYKHDNSSRVEITIKNLEPMASYDLCLTVYEKDASAIKQTKVSERIRIIPALPLPLLLCWGYLAEVAHQHLAFSLADRCFIVMTNHFVCSKAPDSVLRRLTTNENTGVYHDPVYELFDVAVKQSSTEGLRTFIQSTFRHVDRVQDEIHEGRSLSMHGMGDMLSSQLCRLRACRDLLMAAELSKTINDNQLLLMCAMKAYQKLLPFVLFDIPCAFVLHVLLNCHEIILKNSISFENDRVKRLREFFVPLSYHTIRRLQERDFCALAVRLAEESIQLINTVSSSTDLRIFNSISVEQAWVGYPLKSKKLIGNQAKMHYYMEFLLQGKMAVSNNPRIGFDHVRKHFDVLYEYLETSIVKNSQIVSKLVHVSQHDLGVFPNAITVPEASISKKPQILQRKTLDMQASMKDVFTVFSTSGPDATVQELFRFKKNPRYVELISKVIEWCLEKDFLEAAVRISVDFEDWADKRIQSIINLDFLTEDAGSKREVTIKRRKRPIFVEDKNLTMDATISQAYYNATEAKHVKSKNHKADKKLKMHAAPPLAIGPGISVPVLPTTQSELPKSARSNAPTSAGESKFSDDSPSQNSNSSKSIASLPTSMSAITSESAKSLSTNSGMNSKSSSTSTGFESKSGIATRALVTASVYSSESSVAKLQSSSLGIIAKSQGSVTSNDSNSHESVREGGTDGDISSSTNLKKKRHQIRHAFFAGMTGPEREYYDHAVKVLDRTMSELWHRRRYLRRLRTMLDYESSWRSQIAFHKGRALLAQLRKEFLTWSPNITDPNEFFDLEWFEYRKSGSMFLDTFLIFRHESVPGTESDLTFGNNPVIGDTLQSFIQSIVIAARATEWLKATKAGESLWDAIRFLVRHRKLCSEHWRKTLWRGIFVAAEYLMDALKAMHVTRAEKVDAFLQLGFLSQFNTNRQPTRSAILPFSTLTELYKGQFIGNWIDRYGEKQTHVVDLPFFAEFFLFAIECMHVAKQWNRLHVFVVRFQKLFHNVFDIILNPILEKLHRILVTKEPNVESHVIIKKPEFKDLETAAMDYLIYARYCFSAYMLQKVHGVKVEVNLMNDSISASDAYEETITLAHKQNDYDVFAVASNEHGDLLYEMGNLHGACVFWSKCVDALFKRDKALASWRQIIDLEKATHVESWGRPEVSKLLLAVNGVYNSVLAATAISKIARFFYFNNEDKRSELIWLAAHLYIAPVMGTIPHPVSYIEYATYIPEFIFPFLNVFADKFQCNPAIICDNLFFLTNELQWYGMNLITLPLISLIEHIANNCLQSMVISGRATLLKAKSLVNIGKISLGVAKVLRLTKRSSLKVKKDVTQDSSLFNDNLYPAHESHIQHLLILANCGFSDKVKAHYPSTFMSEFDIARAGLCLKIIELLDLALPVYDAHRSNNMFGQLDNSEPTQSLDTLSVAPAATSYLTTTNPITASSTSINKTDTISDNLINYDASLNEVMDVIKVSLGRVIQQNQFTTKTKLSTLNVDDSKTGVKRLFENYEVVISLIRLLQGSELLSNVFFLQRKFRQAIKWYSSTRILIQDFAAGDPSKQQIYRIVSSLIGSDFFLRTRVMIIKAFEAEGLFQFAKDVAVEGLEEALAAGSTQYTSQLLGHLLTIYVRNPKVIDEQHIQSYLYDMEVTCSKLAKIPVFSQQLNKALVAFGAGIQKMQSQTSSLDLSLDKYEEAFQVIRKGRQEHHLDTKVTLYDSTNLDYFFTAFKLHSEKLKKESESGGNILEAAKAMIRSVFHRPVSIPVLMNVKLAFDTGLLFAKISQQFKRDSIEGSYLVNNALQLLEYVIQEKLCAGGYEHGTIKECILGLLSLQNDNTVLQNCRYLYDAARAQRMKDAITNGFGWIESRVNKDELPPYVLLDLAAFKSKDDNVTSSQIFDNFDLLYVEDSAVLDRNRPDDGGLSFSLKDVLIYRASLDKSIDSETILNDDVYAVLHNRIHGLHKYLSRMVPTWYSNYCLEFEKDRIAVPNNTAGLGWLRVQSNEADDTNLDNLLEYASSIIGFEEMNEVEINTAYNLVFFASLVLIKRTSDSVSSSKQSLVPRKESGILASTEAAAVETVAGKNVASAEAGGKEASTPVEVTSEPKVAPERKKSTYEEEAPKVKQLPKNIFHSILVPLPLIRAGIEVTRLALASLGQYALNSDESFKKDAETRWDQLTTLTIIMLTGSTEISKVKHCYRIFFKKTVFILTNSYL